VRKLGYFHSRFQGIGSSLVEQLSMSAGSFLFFLLAARLLGPSVFGLFALHLVAAQIVHSVAIQWLLLPITTTPGKRPTRELLLAVARRCVVLIGATPFFAAAYANVVGWEGPIVIFVCMVTIQATALVFFDLARYFAIRLNLVRLQIRANAIRWFLSLSILWIGSHLPFHDPILAVAAFVAGIVAGLVLCVAPILRDLRTDLGTREDAVGDIRQSDGSALLSLGLANAGFTMISSIALARASVSAFGAIQAFRSLVNWAPFLLQYMETHIAAGLARNGRTKFTNAKWILGFIFFSLIGELVIVLTGDWILKVTVGPEFVSYQWLFAVMFGLVMLQSYTRTIGIEVRLSGAVATIWIQVVLLVCAAAVIAASLVATTGGLSLTSTIAVMSVTALMQALAMTLGLRSYKRS
jgi:hypothetical protein